MPILRRVLKAALLLISVVAPLLVAPEAALASCSIGSFSANVSGADVNVSATASCSGGVRAVRFNVDGSVFYELGAPSASATWHSNGATGSHTMTVEAAAWGDNNWTLPASWSIPVLIGGGQPQSQSQPQSQPQAVQPQTQSPQPQQSNQANMIRQAFQDILGRDADQSGLNAYLQSGQSDSQVRDSLLNSDECRLRMATFACVNRWAGQAQPQPQPPPTQQQVGVCRDPWVTQAIQQVLGRAPQGSGDTAECDYRRYGGGSWSSYNDLVGKVQIAFGVNSPQPQQSDQANMIRQAFQDILGRDADQSGLNAYLQSGQSDSQVRDSLLNSDECRLRMATFACVNRWAGQAQPQPQAQSQPQSQPQPQLQRSGGGIHAMWPAGETWQVFGDYGVPGSGNHPCDHGGCGFGNQLYGLDFVPADGSSSAGHAVVLPISATRLWADLSLGCLGFQIDGTNLNLTLCHMAPDTLYPPQNGIDVSAGTVVGCIASAAQVNNNDPEHLHMNIDTRPGGVLNRNDPGPLPFNGQFAIEGVSIEPGANHVGLSITSTNSTASNPCAATIAPSNATPSQIAPQASVPGTSNPVQSPSNFAAIAYDTSTGRSGWSWGFGNASDAQARALAECGVGCQILYSISSGYAALAKGSGNGAGWANSGSRDQASAAALAECQKRTSGCTLVVVINPTGGN